MGQDADAIAAVLGGTPLSIVRVQDMTQAVNEAAAMAKSGDAVLLSPACASLDMFRNYAERGHVFAQQVRTLAEQAGGPL